MKLHADLSLGINSIGTNACRKRRRPRATRDRANGRKGFGATLAVPQFLLADANRRQAAWLLHVVLRLVLVRTAFSVNSKAVQIYLDRRFPERRGVCRRFRDTFRLVRTYGATLVDMQVVNMFGAKGGPGNFCKSRKIAGAYQSGPGNGAATRAHRRLAVEYVSAGRIW